MGEASTLKKLDRVTPLSAIMMIIMINRSGYRPNDSGEPQKQLCVFIGTIPLTVQQRPATTTCSTSAKNHSSLGRCFIGNRRIQAAQGAAVTQKGTP